MDTSVRTYSLTLEQQLDGFLAYFPALIGCQTWGRTYEEAVRHAEEALALYLETLATNGEPIPEEMLDTPISLAVTVRTSVIR